MLSPFHPIQMTLGLIVWAIYFVLWYAVVSIACERFTPPPTDGALNGLNMALLVITIVVTLGLLYQAWRGWRAIVLTKKTSATQRQNDDPSPAYTTPQFINYVGVAVYLVAALATIVTGVPALVLTPCI